MLHCVLTLGTLGQDTKDSLGMPCYFHSVGCSFVFILLIFGSPTNIPWFVVSVIVNSVQSFSSGTLAQLGKELRKRREQNFMPRPP
jgi:hypothetical protein